MGITAYPNGLSSFGIPLLGSGPVLTTGNVFFVDSGKTATGADSADNIHGSTPDNPYLTIDYAVGRCTADNGDVIFVMPGHAEVITGAAGIDLDIAGIRVVGVGEGRNRPAITYTTDVLADIDVDAANVTVENLYIDITGVDAVTAGIDVNSADFTLRNCEIVTGDATYQAAISVIVGAARCTIEGCTFRGTSDVGSTAQIDLEGTVDGTVIRGNTFLGACSAANIQCNTVQTNALVEGNHFQNYTAAAHAIEFTGAVTGTIRHNTFVTSIFGNAVDPGSCACFENYWYDSDLATSDLSGIL